MNIMPACGAQAVDGIKPGSLVYLPEDKIWGIRSTWSNVFSLARFREQPQGGTGLDFGIDYTVSFDPAAGFLISSFTELQDKPKGTLCLFPPDEPTPCILIERTTNGQMKLFAMETASVKEWVRVSDDCPGIAFASWKILVPDLTAEGAYRSVFEYSTDNS
jgi:hypothetical protein